LKFEVPEINGMMNNVRVLVPCALLQLTKFSITRTL